MVEAVPDYIVDEVGPIEVVLLVLLHGDSLCRVEDREESDVALPVLAF